MEFIKTLLTPCIPALSTAIISGFVTYFVARKNAKAQIKVVEEQNKHDLDKLMKQHEIDIENLKEVHRLEMEKMEQEHKNKLELQKIEFENKLLQQEKEGQNAMATEALKGVFGILGNAVDAAMSIPEGKQLLGESIKNSLKEKEEEDKNEAKRIST